MERTLPSTRRSPPAAAPYALSLSTGDFPQALDVSGLDLTLWGVPWNASHDGERGDCLNEAEPGFPWAKCSVGSIRNNRPLAYLTAPAECRELARLHRHGRLLAAAGAGERVGAQRATRGATPSPSGACENVPFEPEPRRLPHHDQGLDLLRLQLPPLRRPEAASPTQRQLAPSPARRLVVTLPPGVTVNPSVGAGLLGCSPASMRPRPPSTDEGNGCPNGAKIGDFSVKSPLFPDEFFKGAIYLATPHDNPFGTLVAVYLVAKLPQRGILVKLAGRIDPDQSDGTITASFDGLPQLPYTDLELNFRTGQRAFLISPPPAGRRPPAPR